MQMRSFVLWSAVLSAAFGIVACSGGGSTGGGYGGVMSVAPTATPVATATPTAAPGATATPATTLAEATLLGAAGFINTDNRTVYVLSNDTVTSVACTVASGCTGVWPPVSPPAGVALTTGFTVFTRADLGQTQLAYLNHPLYEYAGDSAAGQTNGNGIISFGGTWTVARP